MKVNRNIVLAPTALALISLCACSKEPTGSSVSPTQSSSVETHDHAGGEHDRSSGHAHDHDASEKHDLGSTTIGPMTAAATIFGPLTPGAEVDVDIRLTGTPQPSAVRAWIGSEDARGSMKSRAESEPDHYHAHVEVPEPLAPDARFWIELESPSGERRTGSIPLPR